MTEAELLVEYATRVDRVWDIIQWWASVTFAVLLAAHVGARSLNKPIVFIVLLLYTLFSTFIAQILWVNLLSQVAIREALAIQNELSLVGSTILQNQSAALGISMFLTLTLTYLCTMFYVVYCYRKARIE